MLRNAIFILWLIVCPHDAFCAPQSRQKDSPSDADVVESVDTKSSRATGRKRTEKRSIGTYHGEGFDSEKIEWEVKFANERHRRPRLTVHERDRIERLKGDACEHIQLVANGNQQMARLEFALPPSRVIDELQVKLWVQSNRIGPELALRIVFPNQVDPRTGNRLRTIVRGDTFKRTDDWQLMRCRTTTQQLKSGLRLLRSLLRLPNIDTSGAYADRVLLLCDLSPGKTDIRLDGLTFGPIVPTIPFKDEDREPESKIPVQFRLGRIFVDERPFFPRIAPFHGEAITQLKKSGFNLLWIPDTEDTTVLKQLKQHDLWAMGTPSLNPKSVFRQVSMTEGGAEVPDLTKLDRVLCWYLGTQIGRSEYDRLVELSRATRAADRGAARPFAADVVNNERVYSRKLQMLGISRHMIGTEFSFQQFRDLIQEKRKQALPGSFTWTWVQTEPVPAQVQWREKLGREQMVIEPEQIRLQVYAGLSAGCRAIGFWKRGLLSSSNPGSRERNIQIARLNQELDLLGGWLTAGEMDPPIPVEIVNPIDGGTKRRRAVQAPTTQGKTAGPFDFLAGGERKPVYSKEIQAAAIRSNDGLLLLPVWYGNNSQYVPDDMSAQAIRMVVPGCEESAQPYAVTTTGIIPLPRKQVLGGLEITLRDFDQTAAIIITTRRNVMAKMTEQAIGMAEKSSRLAVELAQVKLSRISAIDANLRSLGCNPPYTETLLQDARQQVEAAEMLLNSGSHTPAVLSSKAAMTSMRRLQRAHWEYSLNGQSPSASPFTACFQTLTDHWSIIRSRQRIYDSTSGGQNLVPLGNFERRDFIRGGGWTHEQNDDPRIRANAELWSDAIEGNLCLGLIAVPQPQEDPPEFFDRSPVIVATRGVPVKTGQLFRVSGKVRIKLPILGSVDGAMVFDKVVGKAGALRWKQTRGWQEFVFVREIPEDGIYSVRFVLDGLGSFEIDDVKIQEVGQLKLATGGTLQPGSSLNLNSLPPELSPSKANPVRQIPVQEKTGPVLRPAGFESQLRRANRR